MNLILVPSQRSPWESEIKSIETQKKDANRITAPCISNDDKTLKYELSASMVKRVNLSSGLIATHGQSTNDKLKTNLMNNAVTLDYGYSISPLRMGFPHELQLPSMAIVGKHSLRVD